MGPRSFGFCLRSTKGLTYPIVSKAPSMASRLSRRSNFGVVDDGLIMEMQRLCDGPKVIRDLSVDQHLLASALCNQSLP